MLIIKSDTERTTTTDTSLEEHYTITMEIDNVPEEQYRLADITITTHLNHWVLQIDFEISFLHIAKRVLDINYIRILRMNNCGNVDNTIFQYIIDSREHHNIFGQDENTPMKIIECIFVNGEHIVV